MESDLTWELSKIIQQGLNPRACSTVVPPLQKSKNAAVALWNNAERTAVRQQGGHSEHYRVHLHHRTDHFISGRTMLDGREKNQFVYILQTFNVLHARWTWKKHMCSLTSTGYNNEKVSLGPEVNILVTQISSILVINNVLLRCVRTD